MMSAPDVTNPVPGRARIPGDGCRAPKGSALTWNRCTVALAAVVSLLGLTACGTSGGQAHIAQDVAGGSPPAAMPGMSMTPGVPMQARSARGAAPSETARMVCGSEIRRDLAQILKEPDLASGTATWHKSLYTCAYATRHGVVLVSVKDSPTLTSGHRYFEVVRDGLGGAHPITGLAAFGLAAFETTDGTVVFLKDGKTLQVDATRLPAVAGPAGQTRTDVAYAIAADVIGCWSE